MERYYFLFAIALLWIIFASIQYIRKREVANWLNFSLLALALSYRAFYSSIYDDYIFFLFGFFGVIIFGIFAYAFYYSRVFAGGDAKLLIALGAVFPFEKPMDFIILPFIFIFLLFLSGSIYGLVYSLGIVSKNRRVFVFYLRRNFRRYYFIFIATFILAVVINLFYSSVINFLFSLAVLAIPFLYVYLKSVDKCMIKLISPFDLTEGDWLEQDLKVGNKTIRKSVHGLSLRDIELLKKYKRRVLIKEGIPFVPAFLISFVIMVFFLVVLESRIESLVSSLF